MSSARIPGGETGSFSCLTVQVTSVGTSIVFSYYYLSQTHHHISRFIADSTITVSITAITTITPLPSSPAALHASLLWAGVQGLRGEGR